MKALGLGILMIVGGFWLKSHYEPVVQICNTGLGGFAQAISTRANENCSTAQNIVTAAPWLIGVGIAIAIGAVLVLLGFFAAFGLGKSRTKGDA